jgi:hypothetical protein
MVELRRVFPSLSGYDGSAGVLVDANVWVDCIDDGSPWHDELSVPEPDTAAIDELLDSYAATFGRLLHWNGCRRI